MGRKIVITGASSEIGLAICRAVIQPEDEASLHCFRNEASCQEMAQEIGAKCQVIRADFTSETELAQFVKGLVESDILIQAAAITIPGLLVTMKEADILRMIQANVIATVRLCKAVIPSMMSKRKGIIINISSSTAQRGSSGQAVYAGTKGFIEALTRSLAAEYGRKGIRINCVAPGPIQAGSLKSLLIEAEEEVRASVSLNRLGTPEDVAHAVAFLCSDKAAYITGRVIPVDGGFCYGV